MLKAATNLRTQLLSAVMGSAAVRVLAMALSLATSVILARALGPEAFGTYVYVIAILTLLALPAQLGVPTLIVRETAKAAAQRDWPTLNALWRWATQTIVGMSCGIAALAAAVIAFGVSLPEEVRVSLFAGLALIPLIALGNARGAALRGLQRIVLGQLPEMVVAPGLFVIFVSLAWGADWHLDAPSVIVWQVLAALIAFIIGAVLLTRLRPNPMRSCGYDKSHVHSWWASTLPLAIMGGVQTVFNLTGILLLGWQQSEADVAIYKVATAAAVLVSFGLQTISLIMGPHFAHQYALGDFRKLQRLAAVGALASVAMTVPIALLFVVGGRWILQTLFGAVYVGAYGPLLLLCIGQVVAAFFGSAGLLLNMTGLEVQATRWLAIAATSNVLIGLLLVPQWGAYGVAVAASVSTAICSLAYWRVAKRTLGIDSSVLVTLHLSKSQLNNP